MLNNPDSFTIKHKHSTISKDEDILILADEQPVNNILKKETWKILVADDEQEVHNVTRMVLSDFIFDGMSLNIISAYSGKEAERLITENPDTAIVFLDVVMEEDDAGLSVVKYIRQELKNSMVRIILRTGQPGQAPERKVILEYDINDYKEKTELTAQKLFTAIISSLRSYRDITTINNNKKGLEKIIESSATIFELQSMKKFALGVLTQLTSILNLNKNSLLCQTSSFAATKNNEDFYILAATGDFFQYIEAKVTDSMSAEVLRDLEMSFKEKKSIYFENRFIGYFKSKMGFENLIYLDGVKNLSEWDKYLIEIFCTDVSIAFDNIYLKKEVENTQREIIFTLGEITETRSKETGYHVKRVAEYSKLLALKYGLPENEAEVLRLASPMHDIGKLGIPDAILQKPGKLIPEETDIIKKHTTVGYEMLKNSNRDIIKTAAIIALQHHEKYNGHGYPYGLGGEEIHIYGRITAIADIFDALSSERVYKKAWEQDKILEFLKKERGEHFDPVLVDMFFDNLDEILNIRSSFPDKL